MDPPTIAPDGYGQQRTAPAVRVVVIVALVGVVLGAVVGAVAAVSLIDRSAPPAVTGDGVAAVARAVLPSVVGVAVRGVGTNGAASGVVYDGAGHVVTNHHVVAGATAITVTFADGEQAPAELVGSDPRSDLAVIAVEEIRRPPISVADSAEVEVGQLAVAVGSPFGLDGSVSAGVVSAIDRPIDLRGPDGEVERMVGVLQTDAGINPGNSGGPLVDADGRMIGLNSAVLGQEVGGEVGFAIPSATVTDVAAQLIAEGRVPSPYLGLAAVPLAGDGDGVGGGAVVQRVVDGSPAAVGGLSADDVVIGIDGRDVRSVDDVVDAVREAGVGATIDIRYVRGSEERTTRVTLVEADDG